MKSKRRGAVILALLCAFSTHTAHALELPSIFNDSMVLQRDMPVPVWGKAEPGDVVVVTFGGAERRATADADGRWRVDLPAMESSGEPQTLEVTATAGQRGAGADGKRDDTADAVRFTDVLVGDVWHCSGQSNMSWFVSNSLNGEQELAAGNHPRVRLYTQARRGAEEPRFTSDAIWQVATPSHLTYFSAVGYFFGRHLHQELGVPIGLISTPFGGASAEAYVSAPTLRADPATRGLLEEFAAEKAKLQQKRETLEVDWQTLPLAHIDPGLSAEEQAFADAGLDDSAWAAVELPGRVESLPLGATDGVFWFRRTVEIPEAWVGQELELRLGRIYDADQTFVNGRPIGQTLGENSGQQPRAYRVPADLVERPRVTVAIRLFDEGGAGGLVDAAAKMYVSPAQGDGEPVTLAGSWRALAFHPMDPARLRSAFELQRGPQYRPAELYNAMIHPVAPFAHRGVIWYQGESNAGRAEQYVRLMHGLMRDWRELWDQPGEAKTFPFLMVQLANFYQPRDTPPDSDPWGDLRLAQMQIAQENDRAWLATAIDIGEADDIHPRNKQEVGRRLALLALRHVYSRDDVQAHGPEFTNAVFNPDQPGNIEIRFEYANGLTTTDGKAPRGFAVCTLGSADWIWAEAELAGNAVKLKVPDEIKGPFHVRYAYQMNPANGPHGINLVNGAGLPALPFDTTWGK